MCIHHFQSGMYVGYVNLMYLPFNFIVLQLAGRSPSSKTLAKYWKSSTGKKLMAVKFVIIFAILFESLGSQKRV
jgi:hypothetical protein